MNDFPALEGYYKHALEVENLINRAAAIQRELAKNPPEKRAKQLESELAEIQTKLDTL